MTGDQSANADFTIAGPAEATVDGPKWFRRSAVGRALAFAAPAVWVGAVLLWERSLPLGTHFVVLLAATPALACAGTGRSAGIWLGGGCALLALYPLPTSAYEDIGSRTGTCVAILCVAVASCYTMRCRRRLADELARTRQVATAAQHALIRPLPPRIDGFSVAAGYLSAAHGAAVGGDLYDAAVTVHGVRVVIGDVRGHGLGAVSKVAAVLGVFREAVHDEPQLGAVLRRLEKGLERHLSAGCDEARSGGPACELSEADEEFVTLLLLEIGADGSVSALNCGHPWPYRLSVHGGAARVEPVSTAEPMPPLGLFPLPSVLPEPHGFQLPPGEGLFLYTDGAEDARDRDGAFFPLRDALGAALAERPASTTPPAPADVVRSVRRGLLRHAAERLPDDVALLVLRNDHCGVHGKALEEAPERPAERLACSCP